ncbi:FCD domain-containing protein [Microbacterium sp. BWT-B31]|uniref:FadR/GntR family transcriptional regulator n=1 Tax=Microbacterium sp. BWT-B31 TaxID=3232072 RepID=UPI003526DE57
MTEQPRAWRIVLDRIEADLVAGRLGPGDRLPSERDLVAQLGVGRSSVREALRVLEVMGLIRTATGSGPNAGAIVISSPTGGMAALLRLQVAAKGFPIADIVATRLLLEEWVMRTLASTPDAERDLALAHETLLAMDDQALTSTEFLALDAAYHLALAKASGNQVVASTMEGLRTSIEEYVLDTLTRIPDWDAEAAVLRGEHHGILEAIEKDDPALAERRVHDHITRYYLTPRVGA